MRRPRRFSATRDTTKALAGIRVLVTRAPDQAPDLVRLLEERGATVSSVPLICIGPAPNERELQTAIDHVEQYAWLVFTSVHGVEAFSRRVHRPLAATVQVAAIGPATQSAIQQLLRVKASLVPQTYSGDALAQALCERADPGSRVLVVAARDASPVLVSKLRARGFEVTKVGAYTTVKQPVRDLEEHIATCDVITLASPSVVQALVAGLGEHDASTKLRGKLLACIGPVTLLEARQRGLHVEIVPESATLNALVDALATYYEAKL